MRLLVLGGTVFLGHAVVTAALARGDQVTCVTRGRSGTVPPGARHVAFDRSDPANWRALERETFDAVVDVARRPSQVRTAVTALRGRVGHWTFVSSGSAYADAATPGQVATTAPLLPAAGPEQDSAEGEAYGPAKVACEEIVVAALGQERTFVCRAGLVVGPGDPYDRFTYWVARLARGGEVLAPGGSAEPVQFIDVRDLAQWLISAAGQGLTGAYDGIGAVMARADLLTGVAAAVSPAAPVWLTWVPQDFLLDAGVQPWMGPRSVPLWLPVPEYGGFLCRDPAPALAAGLAPRPLAQTATATQAWLRDRPADQPWLAGLAAAEEAELLARWHAAV